MVGGSQPWGCKTSWLPIKTTQDLNEIGQSELIILVIKWLGDFAVRRYHVWPVDRIGDDSVSQVPVLEMWSSVPGETRLFGFWKRVPWLKLVSSCFNYLEKLLRNSRIAESLDCWMSFEEFVERQQNFLGSPPRCCSQEQFFAPCFLSWDATIRWKPDRSWTEGMYNMYNRFDSMTI